MIYVYEAIKRPKENLDMSGIKFIREVRYSEDTEEDVVRRLTDKISRFPGVWRIYRSVNARDEVKAKLELISTITKQMVLPKSVSDKNPESLWKDILMQPHNKAERLFLLDVDTKDDEIMSKLTGNSLISILYKVETPNGYHIVCEPFYPELIKDIPDVSVKKDALLYIKTITVSC